MESPPPWFYIGAFIVSGLSIIFSIILMYLLKNKTSNYAQIGRWLTIFELSYVYSAIIVIAHTKYLIIPDSIIKYSSYVGITKSSMLNINVSIFFSSQNLILTSHIFVAFENICTLKNPVASAKLRYRIYFIIILVLGISILILSLLESYELNKNEAFNIRDALDYCRISHLINFSLFIILGLFAIVSLYFIFSRLYVRKNSFFSNQNSYASFHLIYWVIYYTIISSFFSIYLIDFARTTSEIIILIGLTTEVVVFFPRAFFTDFYHHLLCKKTNQSENFKGKFFSIGFLDSDKPLIEGVAKTLNTEFISCVLYGLNKMFEKYHYRVNSVSTSSNGRVNSETNNSEEIPINQNARTFVEKDFLQIKYHKITYENFSAEEFKIEDLGFELDNSLQIQETNIDHKATILEYCPKIFRELRSFEDISNKELEESFNPILNKKNMDKIKESEGKSGSFFFFTHDNKFLIKTLKSDELHTLINDSIQIYYEHMSQNPDSLLAKIYGVYTIIINNVSKVHVMIIQNLIIFPKSHVKRIFDLKGSRVDRFTKKIEKLDKISAFKDLDFLWMSKVENNMIDFGESATSQLESQLSSDLKFLNQANLMDYSIMLIIIKFPNFQDPQFTEIINIFGEPRYKSRLFKSRNENYIYCIGIIDYLQDYNFSKQFENKIKGVLYGVEKINISSVDPEFYAKRMFEFAKNNIFISNKY